MHEDPVRLDEVLGVVAEFGQASLELVAWELGVPVEVVHPVWRRALDEGLLGPPCHDEIMREDLRGLNLRGQARLSDSAARLTVLEREPAATGDVA
jgi:hypothetical protein